MEELSTSEHEAMHFGSKAEETADVGIAMSRRGEGCQGAWGTDRHGAPGRCQGDARQETLENPSGHKKEGDSLVGNYCSQRGRNGGAGAAGMLQWRGVTPAIWKEGFV